MKSQRNEQTIRIRPTLKDGTGRSASLTRDQFTRIYQESCYSKGAIKLFNLIKSVFRNVIVFLDVIVGQVESQLELKNV